MQNINFRWAIMDIKTTGPHIIHDQISEISLIILTQTGIESTWHAFIEHSSANPSTTANFTTVAFDLMALLHGCVLVAHNARFEYAFLKNSFKLSGISCQLPVLCSIKLFKNLYPQLKDYGLKNLAKALQITTPSSESPEHQVKLLHQLLVQAMFDHSLTVVITQAKLCYQKACLPFSLKTDIDSLPDCSGVYLFYGINQDFPLYIGKSIHLRQRIMSHFQADHASAKEFRMSQQVEHIEIIPTAGELSALLLESSLIKEKMPLFNRRLRKKKNITGFYLVEKNGYLTLSIQRDSTDEPVYGAFNSLNQAKSSLLNLIKTYQLCPKLCGIEKTNSSCFSYQLKRCLGACIDQESMSDYNLRVNHAMSVFMKKNWPYEGPIAIAEENKINGLNHYLLFDQWHYLGAVDKKQDIEAFFLKQETIRSRHHIDDWDSYKILSGFLTSKRWTKTGKKTPIFVQDNMTTLS